VASDTSGSDPAPPDPVPLDSGLRLLTRAGDFIATHTRFDRGHIALQSSRSETVKVVLRQAFRVRLDVKRSTGSGDLPADAIAVADADAVARETDSHMRAARAAIQPHLKEWSLSSGDDPLARPVVRDVFRRAPGVGHVEICETCGGEGKLGCPGCDGAGVVPCAACDARGSSPCKACETKGKIRCTRCYGMGYQLRDRRDGGEPERIGCTGCGGTGSTACDSCHGRGRIVCPACHGQKKTPCPQCSGAGTRACVPCEGKGKRHFLVQLDCTVSETWSMSPAAAEPAVAAVLKSLTSPEQLMEVADSHRSSIEIGTTTLLRDTVAEVAVTTISVLAASQSVELRGYGRRQVVRDHAGLAGLLLAQDIDRLAEAMPKQFKLPPRTTPEMDQALSDVLASPANVTIMDAGAERKLETAHVKFSGGIDAGYVRRAASVTRQGVGAAYWAELARWPALALAVPLLQLPFGLLLRGLGDGSRAAGTIGVMLLTIGAVIAAHMWSVAQLQKRIAPSGVPAISRMLDRLKLTRTTMIAGAAWAFIATLMVAGVTSALFPPPR
jgi:hypothetical protein